MIFVETLPTAALLLPYGHIKPADLNSLVLKRLLKALQIGLEQFFYLV